MVFEIRPRVDFHKGKAVRDLIKIVPIGGLLPFYFGDDQTDEDAFRFLRGKGITVFVGAPEISTEAEYFLKTPGEVTEFLKRFIENCPAEDSLPKI
jgi:trehalose-phosphatase